MLTRQSRRAKSLEVRDQLLALGQEPPLREDARTDAALDALHQCRVLAPDLIVEGQELVDPGLVDAWREEVVEEAGSPLGADRQDRAAREVRLPREDVDPEVRPEEVELAAPDLAVREEGVAVLAQRPELARGQPLS